MDRHQVAVVLVVSDWNNNSFGANVLLQLVVVDVTEIMVQ